MEEQSEVARQIHRLAVMTDQQRYEEASLVFADDAFLARPGEEIRTRAAILRSLLARPVERLTRHVIGSCLVERTERGVASTTYVMVFRKLGETAGRAVSVPLPYRPPETVAEYRDDWVQEGGQWRILRRVVQPVFDAGA
ncbi:nuclear transport factor 2 family protein [Candidimonas nitroreducens]|uniref:SnoaL-like domain-containing protein n=1 Tax=Candidimonas nitroreducens TaxID=683354 RepID=A0A225MWS7_9BURK|nr:nuclear transport factor 2 family protein [Candidimonas nitroreducens]OWT65718.1 hypothetical protein CEY11_03020 [Candidimonas nitroreducens]